MTRTDHWASISPAKPRAAEAVHYKMLKSLKCRSHTPHMFETEPQLSATERLRSILGSEHFPVECYDLLEPVRGFPAPARFARSLRLAPVV